MTVDLRSTYRLLPLVVAASISAAVMMVAVSCSRGGIVKGPPVTLQAPDSIFILTKDPSTAKRIAEAFRSRTDASKYSLTVGESVAVPKSLKVPATVETATSQTYYLVSTYGNAPLQSMVLLQSYTVSAGKLGLSTVVGNDASATGGSNTTGGGTSFTSGATNSNGSVTNPNGGATAGIVGISAVNQLRQTLQTINPGLYSAIYFNSQQVLQGLQTSAPQNP